ncbi:MAG TPA: protein-disulfide reductase DsbD domain-containing protein [Puia sp.]|jgi:thiol:disulfide interchange protein DsbD|nr:protein-disulfide reductase DsbD domain-containing protein [Puia sp.]
MKKTLYFFLLLSIATMAAYAQDRMSKNPIQWQYSAKKIGDKTYEVHLTAMLESGWHAYSQLQPEEAVAQPTAIKFKSNPLVGIEGKTKEVGAMEKWQDEATGIKANQYKDQVDFVQIVRLKGNVKTSVSGSLTYQVCTDQMCLPPRTDDFTVKVGQ